MSSFIMTVSSKIMWNIIWWIISIIIIHKYFGTKSKFGRYVFYDIESNIDNFLKEHNVTCLKAIQDILQLKGIEKISIVIDRKNVNNAEYKNYKIILGSKFAEECSLNAVITAAHEVVHSMQDKINYQKYFVILALIFSIVAGIFDAFSYRFLVMIANTMKYSLSFVSIAFVMYTEVNATYRARNLSIEYVNTLRKDSNFVEFVDKYTENSLIWYSINNITLLATLLMLLNVMSIIVKIVLFYYLKENLYLH